MQNFSVFTFNLFCLFFSGQFCPLHWNYHYPGPEATVPRYRRKWIKHLPVSYTNHIYKLRCSYIQVCVCVCAFVRVYQFSNASNFNVVEYKKTSTMRTLMFWLFQDFYISEQHHLTPASKDKQFEEKPCQFCLIIKSLMCPLRHFRA